MTREVDRFAGLHHLTAVELPTEDYEDLKLLTVKAVMSLLSLTEREVYRHLNTGDLQRVKIGAMTRIPLASVRAFVQRIKDEAAA